MLEKISAALCGSLSAEACGATWTAITGVATVALTVITFGLLFGVRYAGRQLKQDRLFNQTVKTDDLVKEWQASRAAKGLELLDPMTSDNETERLHLNKEAFEKHFSQHYQRQPGGAEVQAVYVMMDEILDITDRLEPYARRNIVNIGLASEIMGYNLITGYYYLSSAIQQRATDDDINSESFRDLALRCQAYAWFHPLSADIRDEVAWLDLPRIKYKKRGSDTRNDSRGYEPGWIHQIKRLLGLLYRYLRYLIAFLFGG